MNPEIRLRKQDTSLGNGTSVKLKEESLSPASSSGSGRGSDNGKIFDVDTDNVNNGSLSSPSKKKSAELPEVEVGRYEAEENLEKQNNPTHHKCTNEINQNEELRNTKPKGNSLLSYIMDELRRDYMLELNEQKLRERRKRVYTFMKTPRELEKFLVFGVLLCLDVFLFIFTFLPLRVLLAISTFCCRVLKCGTSGRLLEPVQKIDLLKAVIVVTCSFAMTYVDTSMVYHIVRAQSVIKLYVIYNMIDVVDKLFASFGQDVLDALYWTATEPKGRKREQIGFLPHLCLSLVYVSFHSLLTLVQAIVLNVSINAFNKALLTIMISNQFVELKGSVFKKFEKSNLFQISCSDARERFHYIILILIIAIRNLTEFNWNYGYIYTLLPDLALVMGSELVVDWFKHAFITKFNDIEPEVYETYIAVLAQHIVCSKDDMVFTGHTDQVSRRMGFTALPLACLLIRICSQSIQLHGWTGIALAFMFYMCLCALKLLVSVHVFGKATQYVKKVSPDKIRLEGLNPSETSFKATNSSVQEIFSGYGSDFNLISHCSSINPPLISKSSAG